MEANNVAEIMYGTVLSALDGLGLKYEKYEEDLVVVLGYKGDDMAHRMIIAVSPESQTLRLIEKLPFEINPEKAGDVAKAVCLINSNLLIGGFEYTLGDEISYEIKQAFNESIISESLVERLVKCIASSVEVYDDRLMALNKGYLKVEEIVAE